MKLLIISSSLNPGSRSRKLARAAAEVARRDGDEVDFLDLQELELPQCDGTSAYGHPNIEPTRARFVAADAILIATPIYCYDVAASLKNLAEMTGHSWKYKPVGFLCAAGGQGSYMSVMNFANCIMLDFRCLVIPRFIYTGKWHFDETGEQLVDEDVKSRIEGLVVAARKLAPVAKELAPTD